MVLRTMSSEKIGKRKHPDNSQQEDSSPSVKKHKASGDGDGNSSDEFANAHPDKSQQENSSPSVKKHKASDDGDGNSSDEFADANKESYTLFFGCASPFSQHHPANFTIDGVEYNCAEQYMMHQKAVIFKDEAMGEKILAAKDPKVQKSMGRQVKNFEIDEWKNRCKQVVKAANIAKFSQNPSLKDALLATKGTILVEAAPRDRLWGIGLGKNNPKAKHKANWRGQNWLGYILTDVRNDLLKGENENEDDTD